MTRKIYYTPLLILCLSACTKWYDLDKGISDFSVSAGQGAYKVGEDVKFVFSGNPNIITFYSGEFLNDYAYHEERIASASGAVNFSFRSNVSGGTQPDQLTVLASTDFSGDYENFSKLESANWTDITSRFLLGTSATFRASGAKDISDLIGSPDPNKPLFIAFRYKTYPQADHGTARTWGIQTSLVQTETPFGAFVGDMKKIGYRIMEKYPLAPSRSTSTATAISLRGNTADFDNLPFTDTWAVSDPINLAEINFGPDRPTATIKNNTMNKLEEYVYNYAEPGTYKATFVAINANAEKSEQVTKEVTITVTP